LLECEGSLTGRSLALRGAVELGFVVIGGKKIEAPDAKKRGRKVKTVEAAA
jgi:hypothetical protein